MYTFLLVSEKTESPWLSVLKEALSPLGNLQVMPEQEATRVASQDSKDEYAVIIIDAGEVRDPTPLMSCLRARWSKARLVIVTASPTWQRARLAFQAGAADYIRKSLNDIELRSKIEAVLKLPPPLQTG